MIRNTIPAQQKTVEETQERFDGVCGNFGESRREGF